MRKFLTILAVFVLMTLPIGAQETVTPEPTIEATVEPTLEPIEPSTGITDEGGVEVTTGSGDYPIIDPAAIVSTIINAVYGLVMAAFGAAPITVIVVSILKRVPALYVISAPTLTFATATVLYVGAIIANTVGYTIQFESVLDFLNVAAPALFSFLSTLIGAPLIYNAARAQSVAFIGTSRADNMAAVRYLR